MHCINCNSLVSQRVLGGVSVCRPVYTIILFRDKVLCVQRFAKPFQQLHSSPRVHGPQIGNHSAGGIYASNQFFHWEKMTLKQLNDFTNTTPCFPPTNTIKMLIDTIQIISQFTWSWWLVYNTIKFLFGTRTYLLCVRRLLWAACKDTVENNIIKITFLT